MCAAGVLIAESLGSVVLLICVGLIFLIILLLLRILLRKQWAAVTVLILFFLVPLLPLLLQGVAPLLSAPLGALSLGIFVFVVIRFGLVALIRTFLFISYFSDFPITTQASAWYAGIGFSGLLFLAAMTLYGFYISLAGRPMFGAAALDE